MHSQVECPLWYSRLSEEKKEFIQNLIGDATRSSRDLENLLIDMCGTDRPDIQDLLKWWFSKIEQVYEIISFQRKKNVF